MEHETAGDPISGIKWTRRTTRKISKQLECLGLKVSPRTVACLLKDLGFSLRVNQKQVSTSKVTPEDRDQQFQNIQSQREAFVAAGLPIISVDTKKKELIGNFKNSGTTWEESPTQVLDHDFLSDSQGIAVPYGILDVQANVGRVLVGLSHDTSAFAVDAVVHWWTHEGQRTYSGAEGLLVLADSGGSNGARVRAWKLGIQRELCDQFGLAVTVCHYPSGASKWNPIEHRLFAPISQNWQGRPLDTIETILKYIRTTTTATGLRVRASKTHKAYPLGVKVTDKQMGALELETHEPLPKWNYTLRPSLPHLHG